MMYLENIQIKIKQSLRQFLANLPFSHHLYKLGKYGPNFFIFRALCKKRETFSRSEIEQYQLRKLRALLKHVSRQVPFYRDFFKKHHLSLNDFRTLKDIERLPVIQKSFMRENVVQFIAENKVVFKPVSVKTSGSTGTPFQFYLDKDLICFYDVLYWRWHYWAGYYLNDPYALMCMPIGYRKGIIDRESLYFYDPLSKMLELNTLFFDETHMREMAELINKYKVLVLLGYPYLLFHFARFVEKEMLNLPIRVILSQSEMLYPEQREKIENIFKVKVSNSYTMEERTLFACECPEGRMHVSFESGILEVIKNGKLCKPGEIGEFVLTGLHNRSMPFIRYAIGDFGCYKEETCPCGSSFPVIEVHGDRGKSLFDTSKGYINIFSEYAFLDKNLSKRIKQIQIYQDKIDEIILKVVKDDSFSDADEKSLVALYSEILGGEIKILIEFVEKIERSPSGKFKYVDSEIGSRSNNALS